MTVMWFGLAAIALAGALALLYVDRTRREQSGRVREIWARAQGYKYSAADDSLPGHWHRAALAKQEYLGAVDVVHGIRRGEEFILFDIEETATIVAVRRKVGSDVDIDLRLKSTPPPKDPDMNLLGAIGPRIVFATDLEIARRICDQRMVAYTESIPPARADAVERGRMDPRLDPGGQHRPRMGRGHRDRRPPLRNPARAAADRGAAGTRPGRARSRPALRAALSPRHPTRPARCASFTP